MNTRNQKTSWTNPNATLTRLLRRVHIISKPIPAIKIKKVPGTLKPFRTFLSFIIALIRRRTAIRLTMLAKSATTVTESISVKLAFMLLTILEICSALKCITENEGFEMIVAFIGQVAESKIITGENIKPGDPIIGLPKLRLA